MLTMPLATVIVVVAANIRPKRSERPGSKPPEDHKVL